MATHGFARGREVPYEELPKDSWQRARYEQGGTRFYEPLPPAPATSQEQNGELQARSKTIIRKIGFLAAVQKKTNTP